MAVAVSKAHELGIRKVALASDGNAAAASAAYAAKAGMEASIIMPADVAPIHRQECSLFGAKVILVRGNLMDCARVLRETLPGSEWFDITAFCEPYRLEGTKTLAFEVCESQMGGRLPDAIIYPTGEGAGLIGMWKAFDEMQEMGWIKERRPRMFAIQSHGCAPLVRAYGESAESAAEWPEPHTIASGLSIPATKGDSLVLRTVRKSRGAALAVSDAAMLGGMRLIAETEGNHHLAGRRRNVGRFGAHVGRRVSRRARIDSSILSRVGIQVRGRAETPCGG